MQSASVARMVIVNAGLFRNCRTAKAKLFQRIIGASSFLARHNCECGPIGVVRCFEVGADFRKLEVLQTPENIFPRHPVRMRPGAAAELAGSEAAPVFVSEQSVVEACVLVLPLTYKHRTQLSICRY